MANQMLKLDNTVLREPDRGTRNPPVSPLTEKEIQHLYETCWEKCRNGYCRRMKNSGLLSDWENPYDYGEREGEAYIFFMNILRKFDKSKCGQIADFDIEGAKNAKTLEFYFKNYFYQRINLVALEARKAKRSRGVGVGEAIADISYDEHTDSSGMDNEYFATGEIIRELENKSLKFKRFFKEYFIVGLSHKELKEEWGNEFNELKNELMSFKNDLKRKHKGSYLKEIGKAE
jgi:hypothetical protein